VAVELSWQEKDRIILTTYSGHVTPDELTRTIETIIGHVDKAAARLDVIVDWRETTEYPLFADFMFPGLKLIRMPRMGWLVLVGESSTLKLWVDLFANISDFRYKIVSTPQDAVDFLHTVIS